MDGDGHGNGHGDRPDQPGAVTLWPRLAAPVGASFFAGFLALVGWVTLEAGGWRHAWWAVTTAWGLAALFAWASITQWKGRRMLAIHFTLEGFSLGDLSVRRFQVTAVRMYKDLHFKGVRVDLGPDAWLPISATHHEPGRVLEAFRKQNYPVV